MCRASLLFAIQPVDGDSGGLEPIANCTPQFQIALLSFDLEACTGLAAVRSASNSRSASTMHWFLTIHTRRHQRALRREACTDKLDTACHGTRCLVRLRLAYEVPREFSADRFLPRYENGRVHPWQDGAGWVVIGHHGLGDSQACQDGSSLSIW
jgi:hypothetical protein